MICHLRDNIHQIYWLHVTYRVCKEKSQIWFCKNESSQEKFECHLLKLYSNFQKHKYVCFFLFLTEIVWDLPKNNQICCAWKILHIVFKKLLFLHDIPPTCRRPQIEMSHETKHVYLELVLVRNFVKNLALLSYFFGIVPNQLVSFTCSGFRHVRSVLLNTNIRQTLCCCGPYFNS